MVHQSFRNTLKKVAIPFAVLSTSSLLFTLKASAESFWERGDITKHGLFNKENILERGGSIQEFKDVTEKLGMILDKIIKGMDWIAYAWYHPDEMSIKLLTSIYEVLTKVVLTTPTFIFNNTFIQSISLKFSLISIVIVTALTIVESIMQITRQKHTKIKTIIKRYFGVVTVTGFAPFLFEKGFDFINKLTSSIISLGGDFSRATTTVQTMGMANLDVLIMFAFDITLLAMLIPIMLQNGRRWWDLMCLSATAPIAGVAFVFDRYRHYFDSWWSSVKRLSMIQLVYGVFITLLGVFIFATRDMVTGWELIIKLLIAAGGMWRLLNPPRIVLNLTQGDGKDVFNMYDDYKSGAKKVIDTVTFKNFRPVNFIKSKLKKNK